MGKLSSAIVQRKLASLRDVEEALARQVLYGGDLATNLLEQTPGLDEQALAGLLAETNGLAAAPAGELPSSPPEARLLVPGDVALRHGLYPLSHADGMLTVAVSEPLKPEVEQDLSFGLGVSLSQRVAPLVRIRQAISREYGMPLDRRSQRVVAKLEGRTDPNPSMTPPPLATAPELSELPRPPTMPPLGLPVQQVGLPAPTDMTPLYARLSGPAPITQAKAEPDIATLLAVPVGPARAPEPERFEETPALPGPPESIHERLTAPAPAVEPIKDEPTAPWPAGGTAPIAPLDRRSEPPPASRDRISAIPPERGSVPPPSRRPGSGQYAAPQPEALAAWTAESKAEKRRSRSRHRGPYTAAQAEQDLIAAEGRDDVLNAFFDFACQYFEYAALFVVHGDLAEGRAASGPGADRSVVTGIGVPLDLPSSLATARNEGHFSIAPLAKDGLDARFAADLSRKAGKKVLLLPVTVRSRCVVVFYGDDGAEDVALSEIGDVIAFAPLVAASLENIIRKKKAAVRTALGEPPVSLRPMSRRAPLPSREARAEALTEALNTTVRSDVTLDTGHPASNDQGSDPVVSVLELYADDDPQNALTPAEGLTRQNAARRGEPQEDEVTHPPKRMVRREEMASVESIPPEPNPASAAIAVAPQLPVRRHRSEELRLPSVILNIESDIELLAQKLVDGDESVIPRLTGLGAAAASVLVARFPGPTKAVESGRGAVEPASQRGPVLKALARIGQMAVPFIAVRSADPDAKVREWATLLLGELASPDSAQAIARRVTDSNSSVRRAALDAGRSLQANDDARTVLRDRITSLAEDTAAPVEARVAALEALAHFRETRAIPRVIQLVDKNDEASQSAQWALSIIARQAFGKDVAAWQNWWKENGARHRVEWLIDALMHEDAEIRRASGEELKALTKEYFGYYDDLSKGERAKAQRRYREWWESTGKARFSR